MKLLLIDDHPLFQQGLSVKLRQDRPSWILCCAGSAEQGRALLVADPAIDIALVDLHLPDMDGFSAMTHLARVNPAVPRIVISGREDALAIQRARQAGASGFIFKSDDPDNIVALIEGVRDGGSGFAHLAASLSVSAVPELTARQLDVLKLLSEGCSNKEMRYRLGIAERTVRVHLTELFLLLGVHSRVQAIISARAMGLIA